MAENESVGLDPRADINSFLERAYGTGHFMVLVLRRDDEGVKINRVTNDFKTADFLKAVELVAANLFAEQERIAAKPVVQPPLPRAYPFKFSEPLDVRQEGKLKSAKVGAPDQPVIENEADKPLEKQRFGGCATPPVPSPDIVDSLSHGYGADSGPLGS